MKSALLERVEACEPSRRLYKIYVLSPREREVLSHAAFGQLDQEIAGCLRVSERTVRHYFTILFHKLGVRNRVDVAMTGLLVHVANCEECLHTMNSFRRAGTR